MNKACKHQFFWSKGFKVMFLGIKVQGTAQVMFIGVIFLYYLVFIFLSIIPI